MSPDRPRRWTAQMEDAGSIERALRRWGVDPQAAHQGRVFVDRRRATGNTHLSAGEVVEVFPPRDSAPSAQVSILAKRDGVVAVFKPAGIPTIPSQRGTEASVIAAVARMLGLGDPSRIHLSSRLDADVSGVLLAATTPRARESLRAAREAGLYQRHYVAISSAVPEPPNGVIDAPIGRAPDRRLRRVGGADAVDARTRYAVAASAGGCALIAAEPVTGRTHQIRVHLAHAGAPLVGDPVYAPRRTVVLASGAVRDIRRIALHAAWVRVQIAPHREPWVVRAAVPTELEQLWRQLGGVDEDWPTALAGL
jgi:23S rRNA pseudouridine1911/1915/1917 synthase